MVALVVLEEWAGAGVAHQMVTGHGGQRVLVYGNEEEDVNEEEADGEEDVDVVQHWEQAFQGMRSAVLDVEVRDKIQV